MPVSGFSQIWIMLEIILYFLAFQRTARWIDLRFQFSENYCLFSFRHNWIPNITACVAIIGCRDQSAMYMYTVSVSISAPFTLRLRNLKAQRYFYG